MATPPLPAWNRGSEPAPDPAEPRRGLRGQEEMELWFASTADRRFEQRALLGQGGMGAVHRVRDRRLGREAALKVIKDPIADPVTCERFLREARVMSRLNHPSIPPLFEAGRAPSGKLYMLMRLVEGQTLAQRIAEHHAAGRPEDDSWQLLEVLVRAGEAIAYAHSQGVLHRDLKPANIMIGRFGEVMVLDWGLAKVRSAADETLPDHAIAEDPSLTGEGSVIGTPGYMAPEQARGEEVDERADVFALGACLCEVLSGAPPVQGSDALGRIMQTIKGQVRRPSEQLRGVHRDLDALAAAALEPDPERRLASAEAFVQDLRRFLSGRELAASPYTFARRVARLLRRRSGAAALMGALFLAAALSARLWVQAERAEERRAAGRRAERARREADEAAGQAREILARSDAARRVGALFEKARASALLGLEAAQVKQSIEAALEAGGETPAALLKAAQVYALARCDAESVALVNRALELSDGGADLIQAAEACRLLGDKPRAAALLTDAANSPERGPEALFRLHLLQARGRELRGTPALKRLLALPGPADGAASLARALKAAASERFEEATRTLNGLELDGALAPWLDLVRALIRARKGEDSPVLQALEAALARGGPSAEAYRLRGDHHFRLNRWGKAQSDYKRALKLNPRCVESRIGLGAARHKLGRAGTDELAEALKIDPEHPRALAWLGEIERRAGEAAAASARVERALELDPGCARALLVSANLAANRGDLLRAVEECSRAIDLGAPPREAFRLRANLFIDIGSFRMALKDCDRLVRLDASYRRLRGRVFAKQRRDREALEDFEAAYAAGVRDARLLRARGLTLYHLKSFDRAEADFNEAIRLDPELIELYFYRGQLSFETKRRDLGEGDLRRFIEGSPGDSRSKRARQMLERIEDARRKP